MPLLAPRARAGDPSRIKGTALREFLRWYRDKHGQAALGKIVESLPVDERRELHGADEIGVLPNVWYSTRLIHALLDRVGVGLSPAQRRALAEDSARTVMAATLKGVYRVVFEMMMSPDRYAKHAQLLWGRYYDSGTIVKEAVGPRTHRTRIMGWGSHHSLLCDLHVASGRYIYEAMGCRNVVMTRVGCVDDPRPECCFEARWA